MWDTYLQDIFSMMTIQTLSLMSPGPDFAVVTKESLIRGRSFGLTAALGITCGVFFHLTYIYFGLANLIVANRNVFIGFKFFGIVYLAYLGFSSIFSGAKLTNCEKKFSAEVLLKPKVESFRLGFVTNALNPKCMLFMLSLFSVVLAGEKTSLMFFVYALIIIITTFLWFSFVAIFLSHRNLREKFLSRIFLIERATGAFLILLSLKLVFS